MVFSGHFYVASTPDSEPGAHDKSFQESKFSPTTLTILQDQISCLVGDGDEQGQY